MVKRLEKREQLGKVWYTPITQDREEAVEKKLRLLHGSFFGKPIVKFEVNARKDVYVPYCYLVYHFHAERGILFRKNGLEKVGDAGVIFDLNEAHPFQYDVYESGGLKLTKKIAGSLKRTALPAGISQQQMQEQTEEYIQDKIMKRFYGRPGQLELKKQQYFFRPAVELQIVYKNGAVNKRYAYLDDFGVESEHILGLKYRVENNF
ncbi:hypothetical protein NIA71_12550 [Ihubacter massiliensis]|uniref:Uncharacterized protein n=1 Tax=Hominibacterium faecale TaxID=2839743 RepID=A0A9J6QRT3_9FIRM|nr:MULTISPECIES: hypothetical protein [Eubacteriales Family XIII. Incertae Sedis]MCI7304193.1 hypothetical protein [Clostridia bacterium]MDE8731713.1 hypothetical protein [Eubacteriales bacterium DFI.9.88]MDY3012633.1 hypothetical protein [Clostridiales Family XIII bacterium]MCO7122773.1 hypothetical protein [Ihubacter massiliensis]MCU7377047.1 hypothetical protein [Hominibacterium faecale]